MNERHVEIRATDGTMETFVARPDSEGPFPAIILYMDAPGIREELRGFARRIASQGYLCLLPDLYYRRGRIRLDLTRGPVEELRREMFGHMRSLSNAGVMSDTAALLEFLDSEAAASKGPMGCIGYCMSGQYVMSAAGTYPERVRASVSCYGVGIVTEADDSPHRLADRVQGEMFFAFAERDEYVPAEVLSTLRATLQAHAVRHRLEVYPGTEHGFCFPERPAYVKAAAEDVWRRSFELFARQLKA
ncbi:MAG: dienelactone hydrolase family protein [Myxococcota bacterium]